MNLVRACRDRERISRVLYWAGWVGMVVCLAGWLFGWISDRAMLGVTLALSWLTFILDARTAHHVDGPD